MSAGWFRTFGVAASLASLGMSVPSLAQFEVDYPTEPPKEGQTLLEWADPPILKYSIPEEQRGNVSSCTEISEYDLDKTALTCWPVLRAAQLFLLADYAAGEPTGDRNANLRDGIALADQTIALIGEPEWPLQEYLLIRARELKLNSLMKLGEWDEAYEASLQLVSTIESDLFQFDEFRLAYALRDRGQVFLELDLYEGAQLILEDARELLEGFDGEKAALPFSNHSEDMIIHAIRNGDLAYAEQTVDLYLAHVRQVPDGMQFGIFDHLDLKLYLTAARGDLLATHSTLKERLERDDSYTKCSPSDRLFPAVLAPMRQDEDIVQMLVEFGCGERALAKLDAAAENGIRDRKGELILPYIEEAQ